MILYLLIILGTLFFFTFLGYVIHWSFHQKWSGKFYKSHLNHHTKQYPASNFYSDVYRDAGKDNSVYLFMIVFSPLIITMLLLTITNTIPYLLGSIILAEMAVVGFLNNEMHDSFHIKGTMWEKLPFFKRLTDLHYIHHVDMSRNFGIFSFVWDKVFGTYEEIDNS